MKRMLIIDGHNLLFRMFFGIPAEIKNSRGKDIRGTIGFTGSLIKLINQFSPEKILVIFDSENSTSTRKELSSSYKANRVDYSDVPVENNPYTQLEDIFLVLNHLKISYLEGNNYEADDYIGSICERYKGKYEITIVSTDRDFLQLIDNNVQLLFPRGKLSILYDSNRVMEQYKILPFQYVDYKALVGDKSDNISGVRGIGPKTASLILQAGSLNSLLHENNGLNEKLYSKLTCNKDNILLNKQLININRKIEISDIIINSTNLHIKKFKTMDILRICKIN